MIAYTHTHRSNKKMGGACCKEEKTHNDAVFRLYMDAGDGNGETEQLHGIVRQHVHSQQRPVRDTARDARRCHMMNLLCSDSVQWQLAEKSKTYAKPCLGGIHATRGSVAVDVIATFTGQDFRQDELDELAGDPLFVQKLVHQTGLDLYEHCSVSLSCVPSNADSLMFSVQANCTCVQ